MAETFETVLRRRIKNCKPKFNVFDTVRLDEEYSEWYGLDAQQDYVIIGTEGHLKKQKDAFWTQLYIIVKKTCIDNWFETNKDNQFDEVYFNPKLYDCYMVDEKHVKKANPSITVKTEIKTCGVYCDTNCIHRKLRDKTKNCPEYYCNLFDVWMETNSVGIFRCQECIDTVMNV